MSYFAAAVVRGPKGWAAYDFDLSGVSDIEDVADRLRDVDLDAEVSLLFVEIDEEYLALLRLDDGEDLRVFASDAALAEESRLGAVLAGDLELPNHAIDIPDDPEDPDGESEDDDLITAAGIEPVGDLEILGDLGVSSRRLLAMCAAEGKLPSDVTTEICEALGCADEVEELREA